METFKKISLITALFFLFGIAVPAQTDQKRNTSEPKSDQKDQTTRVDTVTATPSIVVDSSSTNSYNKIAREMTIKLLEKTNITFDQAGDIEEILIDYQKDIAEARNRGTDQSDKNGRTETDEDKREMLGGRNDENLSEIDKETNSKIEDVLSDDQVNTYLFVKEEWWTDLKSKVYNQEDRDQKGIQDQDNRDMNNQNPNPDQNQNPNPESNQNPNPDQDQNPNPDQGQVPNPDHHGMDKDTSPDTGRTGQNQNEVAPADSLQR